MTYRHIRVERGDQDPGLLITVPEPDKEYLLDLPDGTEVVLAHMHHTGLSVVTCSVTDAWKQDLRDFDGPFLGVLFAVILLPQLPVPDTVPDALNPERTDS